MYCRIFSKVQQWGNKSLPGLPADNSYLSFIEFLFVHFWLKFVFGACIVSEIDLFQSKSATQWATNHWWNCCWHLRARKDNQGLQNGQQDQNTFSAVYFSWGNDVRGGVCHNLSWFLRSFLFWCSTHNFDFLWSVPQGAGGHCPRIFLCFSVFFFVFFFSTCVPLLCRWIVSWTSFCFFLHFFCVSPTHLCSIVVQVAEISAAQFLPKVKLPRIHFALVSNFLKRSLFSTLSRKTLWSTVRISFSLITIPLPSIQTFDRPGAFFAISALIQFAGSSQFGFELKLRFSENHFPTSVTLPTITPHRHGFEEFGFGLWKFPSSHSDMMGLNREIFSFKLSQTIWWFSTAMTIPSNCLVLVIARVSNFPIWYSMLLSARVLRFSVEKVEWRSNLGFPDIHFYALGQKFLQQSAQEPSCTKVGPTT